MPRTRTVAALALFAVLATAGVAHAEPVRGIRPRLPRVVAPRGGVLLLPLDAERPGDRWPDTLEVRFEKGGVVRGDVAWLGPLEVAPDVVFERRRRWTGDFGRLLVRPVQPTDDSGAPGGGGPYLVAQVPRDGAGDLRLAKQKVTVDWCDVPPSPTPAGPDMPRVASFDRPDPDSPFEYWRWVLLAEQLERGPPEPPSSNELEALVARHTAELWRIALARLHAADPDAAARCRRLLTATCLDGDRTVACWVADAGRLAELLAYMLDFTRDDRSMRRLVGAWLERERAVVWWPEGQYGDRLAIAMINRGAESALISFRWSDDDIPIAVRLEPMHLARSYVDRRPPPPARGLLGKADEAPAEELIIDVAGRTERLAAGRRFFAARPPGVLAGPLRPPLTLRDALAGTRPAVAIDRSTFVQLRRLAGRWEVFFDCRRPRSNGGATVADGAASSHPLDDLRGTESVALLLGPSIHDDGPTVLLTVPETGWHDLRVGRNDGSLEIHRRSYQDRWYARIVVPDAWLLETLGEPVLMGFARAHGDTDALDTGPGQSLPWSPVVGRIAVDVTRWDE